MAKTIYKISYAFILSCLVICVVFLGSLDKKPQNSNLSFELEKQVQYNKLLEYKIASLSKLIFDVHCKRSLSSIANSKWVYSRIIRFEPSVLAHSFWIDFGKHEGAKIHAPVCLGYQIIGVIDKVQNKRARVRCITDPLFAISIQSGSIEHNKLLIAELTQYIEALGGQVLMNDSTKNTLKQIKGYTQGLWDPYSKKKPLIKAHIPMFVNEESPGSYIGHTFVTNGFDGVFPPNFIVGIAMQCEAKDNGLELKLQPTVQLDTIHYVFVLCKEELSNL